MRKLFVKCSRWNGLAKVFHVQCLTYLYVYIVLCCSLKKYQNVCSVQKKKWVELPSHYLDSVNLKEKLTLLFMHVVLSNTQTKWIISSKELWCSSDKRKKKRKKKNIPWQAMREPSFNIIRKDLKVFAWYAFRQFLFYILAWIETECNTAE